MQGVGYTNELLSRLSSRALRDSTQTNHTHPFPLHRPLYVDFTHDTLLASVLSTLSLAPTSAEQWKASALVPFAGNLVVERVVCDDDEPGQQRVRALLNDRVVGEWSSVAEFKKAQAYAQANGEGDWQRCGWHAVES